MMGVRPRTVGSKFFPQAPVPIVRWRRVEPACIDDEIAKISQPPDHAFVEIRRRTKIDRVINAFRARRPSALFRLVLDVAEKHGMTIDQMRGASRIKPITSARGEFYYRALNELGAHPTLAAEAIGKDRSTVSKGAKRYSLRRGLPA